MSLHVQTARVSYAGPDRLPIVRAGAAKDPSGFPFAPSERLLRKAIGKRDHDALVWSWYVEEYTAEMRESYRANRSAWDALLARERVVLVCYCPTNPTSPSETECHRTVLAEILVKLGAIDGGEIA